MKHQNEASGLVINHDDVNFTGNLLSFKLDTGQSYKKTSSKLVWLLRNLKRGESLEDYEIQAYGHLN